MIISIHSDSIEALQGYRPKNIKCFSLYLLVHFLKQYRFLSKWVSLDSIWHRLKLPKYLFLKYPIKSIFYLVRLSSSSDFQTFMVYEKPCPLSLDLDCMGSKFKNFCQNQNSFNFLPVKELAFHRHHLG